MGTKTITVQPNALLRRASTSYWNNYERMWDGDKTSTYCTRLDYESGSSTDNHTGYFLVDLSPIPKNATILSIQYRAYIYTKYSNSSYVLRVKVGTSTTNDSSGTRTDVTSFSSLPKTTYQVTSESTVSQAISASQSATLLTSSYVYLALCGTSFMVSSDYLYEIYLDITYVEASSKVFCGDTAVSAIYIGNTKAKAVYIGTTKVL